MRLPTSPAPTDVAPNEPATESSSLPVVVRRAALIGSAAAVVVYVLLASAGRLSLMHTRFTSDFYDVQARRLFHGHLTVPGERFGLEAFVIDGHVHTYFGLLPAILRMPVLLVTSRFDGRLTQVSMAAAFVVLLWFTARLSWRIRVLMRGDEPVDRLDLVCSALAPFLVGAGSVALYLGASPVVYHEAILWGIATSVATFAYLVDLLVVPSLRTLISLGVALTATLLSRASLGFGAVVAIGIVFAAVALHRIASALVSRLAGADAIVPSTRNVIALGAVLVLPMALYIGINEARFHRALGPPYAQQVWTEMSADRRAALDANGGSLFNVEYAPSTALAYLRPDGMAFVRLFPFVEFPASRAAVIGNVVFDTRDRTASIPATMPALTVLAVVGGWAMVTRRRRDALAPLRSLVAGGVVAVAGVLTIGFIAHRYVGDFVPLLVPLALVGLVSATSDVAAVPSTALRRGLWTLGALLVAASVWANVGLGLLVQRAYWAPDDATRHDFLTFQQSLDERLFDDARYLSGSEPPTTGGTRGQFFVVGECESLYWHDGWVWVPIEPLDNGATPLCLRLRR